MKTIEVIVETPKGSALKYYFSSEPGFLKIKKALPAGMVFPYDFGFIPGTKGEDGDPLDIVIISEFQSLAGCVMDCRLIGVIRVKQVDPKNRNKKIRNDRFIGIPVHSVIFEKIRSIHGLPGKAINELAEFFIQYAKMENKLLTVIGVADHREAAGLIKAAGL